MMRYVYMGNGWHYMSKGFKFLLHGGNFYFSLKHPIYTLKWWWRFCYVVPKRRGWRWG